MGGAWEFISEKVVIGIPHTGMTSMNWAFCFKQMALPPNWEIIDMPRHPVDLARDLIAYMALAKDADYLVFLDSDTKVHPGAILELLRPEYRQYPILSGVYWTKAPPCTPAAWVLRKKGDKARRYEPLLPVAAEIEKHKVGTAPDGKTPLCKVDVVGAGFLRIDMRVFKEMLPPWFVYKVGRIMSATSVLHIPKDCGHVKIGDCRYYYEASHEQSEDFTFCRRAQEELGIYPVLHMGLVARHDSYNAEVNENGQYQTH